MPELGLMEMLRRSGGMDALSKQLGISPATASAGVEALLPAILGGFRKRTEAGGGGETGLGGLIEVLGGLGGGEMVSAVLSPDPTDVSRGNDMLGQIFGTKDVSRNVAQDAASRTGIDPATLKKMLPILAMLIGGYLSARAGGSGMSAQPDSSGFGSLLDLNGDGNPLDDIIGMTGKLFK